MAFLGYFFLNVNCSIIIIISHSFSLKSIFLKNRSIVEDFPGAPMVKNPPANAEDMGSTPVQQDSICRRATKLECHNEDSMHLINK